MAEENETLQEILKILTVEQLKFVHARMWKTSDKEAAEAIGIDPTTVYGWPNKKEVNKAVKLAQMDSITIGRERLRRLISAAVNVLEDEMKTGSGSHRHSAAIEVLDRAGLVATKRQEIANAPGQGLIISLTGNIGPDDL